ncbi:histone-lysine N-methyltransferase NSD2-like isoform X1 [Mytilus edulis]|uniref:histone-lysine N-methyltransferase NSD2-like isoform X1 n=1 Tax=Mytilus edulis TaxID=6550 RepID=UPI0039F0B5AB
MDSESAAVPNHQAKSPSSPKKNPTMNGTSQAPSGFRHILPQIPTMNRNPKIAQSKASAKKEVGSPPGNVGAKLVVEDASKVVTMDVDLKQEPSEELKQEGVPKENEELVENEKSKESDKSPPTSAVSTLDPDKKSEEKSDNNQEQKSQKKLKSLSEKSELKASKSPEKSEQRAQKSPEKKGGSYKNIFDDKVVEGKRQRKPKVISDDLTGSPKTAVKTPEVKIKKRESLTVVEEEKPVEWLVGDCLWGKVAGHPWWPCMVSFDPHTGIYTKMQGKSRMYHMQYFGDECERGWVYSSSVMEFKGKKDYDEHVKQAFDNAKKSDRPRLEKLYKTYPGRLKAWNIAILEAESALPLSRNERKQKYIFDYEQPKPVDVAPVATEVTPLNGDVESSSEQKKSDKSKKRTSLPVKEKTKDSKVQKRKLSLDVDSPNIPKAKKIKVSKEETPVKSETPKVQQIEGCFEVFCQKNKDTMMEEHPGFTEEMLADLMKQQWCMMSQKQKARYKSKFASDEPGAKKKRMSKPTAKKVELEEMEEVVPEEEEVSKKKKSSQKSTEPEEQEKPEKVPKVKRSKSVKESKPVVSDQVEPMETEETVVPNEEDQDNSKSAAPKPTGLENEEPEFEILKLASSGPQKAEKICQICEKDGDLLDCTGPCLGTFHANCLGLKDTAAENFKCDECTTGNHTCFKCKKADTNTRKCGVVQCGKFYHEDCVKSLQYAKCENKNFTCPLHACESCCAEQTKKDKSSKGARLLRCVRCPTAYHVGEFCIGAGSLNLPGYNIVCPKHFKPSKSNKAVHSHVNVSWCFSCNNGGSLICCESCPAAFHADCVKIKSTEGSFYCAECAAGKRPLYGDIVWVKLGTYRWWPCQVCHPANVPHNIQHKAHGVGEFPVQFFGSKDYYWIHKGRCFAFQEGDKASKENTANKHLAKIFSKGVYEATEAFKVWKAVKANKEQVEKERQDRKPAPFKYVKTNLPIGSVQIYKADLTEIPRCECKPEQDNPCSSDTDCLNRMLMYECHPAVCPAGEKCQNQRYQKREYPDSEPYKVPGKGWGLKTNVPVKKGQFVNEYVGDLIDEDEVKKRIKQAHDDNVMNFYMLTLDNKRIIDAGPKGNLSRFMNHSCQPNCETQKWTVNGDVRVGLFALHDIPAGSELTFNYNFECLGNDKTSCSCGAANCSGFLGVRPKTAAAAAQEKKSKEAKSKDKKKRKKRKTEVKKTHEDDCFRCGEGGELIMCDKNGCPKSYHLTCLKLSKPPHGKWDCPWHHCDECGKPATKKCALCPDSFCSVHEETNIREVQGFLLCTDHEDSEANDLYISDQDERASSSTRSSVSSDVASEDDNKPVEKKKANKRGRKSKSQGTDDPLAVAPMFDDSDDDGFSGLVIDIPSIP